MSSRRAKIRHGKLSLITFSIVANTQEAPLKPLVAPGGDMPLMPAKLTAYRASARGWRWRVGDAGRRRGCRGALTPRGPEGRGLVGDGVGGAASFDALLGEEQPGEE